MREIVLLFLLFNRHYFPDKGESDIDLVLNTNYLFQEFQFLLSHPTYLNTHLWQIQYLRHVRGFLDFNNNSLFHNYFVDEKLSATTS